MACSEKTPPLVRKARIALPLAQGARGAHGFELRRPCARAVSSTVGAVWAGCGTVGDSAETAHLALRHNTPKIRARASLAEHRRDGRQVFLQLLVARVDGERALVVHLGVLVARLVVVARQLAERHAAARQELERERLRVARRGAWLGSGVRVRVTERGERGARVVEAGVEGVQLEVARRAVGEALAAKEEAAHLVRSRGRGRGR
eukprot:scaffold111500_cov66-Phaeocystis_antarctica.AAC.1